MERIEHAPNIWTIPGFRDRSSCLDLIIHSEKLGYEQAKVNTSKGARRIESVRNNDRVIFTDHDLAAELWREARAFIPERIGASVAIGLNELFRFYRYTPGQQFRRHRDESYIRNEKEASYFTFMIYLNDGYSGGNTTFNAITIRPSAGMALIFLHDLEHSGDAVTTGIKYVLRTDVMYRLDDNIRS
jgi:predicted 2-oxoglutarate/Fe(II)-dependent dioxygenase YbiX